jgi:hypothetical protein
MLKKRDDLKEKTKKMKMGRKDGESSDEEEDSDLSSDGDIEDAKLAAIQEIEGVVQEGQSDEDGSNQSEDSEDEDGNMKMNFDEASIKNKSSKKNSKVMKGIEGMKFMQKAEK